MKLCSYVVMIDSGFAPNPFWRYCTLAACTPNHMRLGLEPGDWILGNRSDHEHRLIYAMQVDERLCLDCYYQNPRFVRKRPSTRTWRQQCGDNIYFRNEQGDHEQDPAAHFHTDPGRQSQDIRGDRVFVSKHYFYFGENAVKLPSRFNALIHHGRGAHYSHGRIVQDFAKWIEGFRCGMHGLPTDREGCHF